MLNQIKKKPRVDINLMSEWEHGLYSFDPKEIEMGKLKYPNQKLFFHDLLTH